MRYLSKALLLIGLILCMCGNFHAAAFEQTTDVVRVGFPILAGTSYIDEHGEYAGYLVDYINQLTSFTNWNIEYVQVDGDSDTQLETLMSMLQTGEIDMLGTMNRNAALEDMFLYPNYSYGTRYTVLAVPTDSTHWIEEDFSGWNGIRVAAYSGNQTQISQFAYYATVNEFTYELQQYDSYSDMLQAVQNGQADAVIQSDISLPDTLRIIGRFSPAPYYFALSPNNMQLLQELNTAMSGLNSTHPNLQTELYNLHFRHTDSFQMSDAHLEYINALGTLKVVFIDGDAPFQYMEDGKLTGFVVEYLKRFADITGLQYETVIANSYEDALEMLENGQADMLGCIVTNSMHTSPGNVRFTAPFFNSFSVTACTNPNPHEHTSGLEFRLDTESALSDLQADSEYAMRADYYSLSYYLRKEVIYDDIVVDWANIKNCSYSIGVGKHIPQEFISILNQYASSISNETKQEMLYRYSGTTIDYTLPEWLLVHRPLILIYSLVLIVVVAALLIYMRSKHIAYNALLTENHLMHLTMYDRITGAYNETYFRKLLEDRCEEHEKIALVAFNIRGFKYINDTYGIKRADDMLCDIKSVLESGIHEDEFFCRPPADLFYLALKEQSADALISRTNAMFSKIISTVTVALDGHPLSLYSGAVFVADSPSPYCVPLNISYMMVALAHAKQVNNQQVYIFDETLYRDEQLRYYIETHMRSALHQEEYELYLQPQMNLQTGRIDQAEALVRWHPKGHGMIYPDQFIPLFEENGFCMQLDLYMVEQFCRTLRKWLDAGLSPVVIAINQTKSLFVKEDYADQLLSITRKYNIPPQYITLEILEGLAFENIEALNSTIQKLNDAGFHVSMDDFGSGYSSLNTLGKLKIDELKLDRLFLSDIINEHNGAQREVLASILALAKKLGMRTVVEGVETKESENMIRSMNCDYGQGYYYSKPIPVAEFQKHFCTKSHPHTAH